MNQKGYEVISCNIERDFWSGKKILTVVFKK